MQNKRAEKSMHQQKSKRMERARCAAWKAPDWLTTDAQVRQHEVVGWGDAMAAHFSACASWLLGARCALGSCPESWWQHEYHDGVDETWPAELSVSAQS